MDELLGTALLLVAAISPSKVDITPEPEASVSQDGSAAGNRPASSGGGGVRAVDSKACSQ